MGEYINILTICAYNDVAAHDHARVERDARPRDIDFDNRAVKHYRDADVLGLGVEEPEVVFAMDESATVVPFARFFFFFSYYHEK